MSRGIRMAMDRHTTAHALLAEAELLAERLYVRAVREPWNVRALRAFAKAQRRVDRRYERFLAVEDAALLIVHE